MRRGERGLSLCELMTAFAVFTVLAASVMVADSNILRAVRSGYESEASRHWAEACLERAAAGLPPGPAPAVLKDGKATLEPSPADDPRLRSIGTRVTWTTAEGERREVRCSTLVAGK